MNLGQQVQTFLGFFTRPVVITSIVVCLITYIAFKFIQLHWYVKKLMKIFGKVPGPPRHWLYGNMHLLPDGTSEARLRFGLENVNKYKYMYCWWTYGIKASISVCHPSTVRVAMKTSEPKPTGLFGVYRLALPWLGEGLLIASGDRWSRARKLLTPAFHFEILKPYIDVYNNAAEILIENLGKFADSGEKFEVFTYISKVTLDIIMRCAFSYHTDVQREGGATHPYVKAVDEISTTWNYRARRIWLYPDWLFYLTSRGRNFRKQCHYVHKVAEEIIEKRKKTLEEHGKSDRKYLDFLDILLTAKDENGEGLTQKEIRNEVDTFLFEGHDTTASAISWILYALATHPECQKRCQEEIDSILQCSTTVEWEDVSKMEYLTMCIKEGMRDHCPVPFIQREFTHDFEINGHKFPPGTTVSLHIYGLHHNKHVWDRPNEYIPERFSKDNVASMDPYQFVPFSAGPRNCIGQHFAMNEEKVVLAKLLQRFWFEVDPNHVVLKKVAAVMRAENGIMMHVRRR